MCLVKDHQLDIDDCRQTVATVRLREVGVEHTASHQIVFLITSRIILGDQNTQAVVCLKHSKT